jgi:phosphoglycerate dehydrogenase-like enzyme
MVAVQARDEHVARILITDPSHKRALTCYAMNFLKHRSTYGLDLSPERPLALIGDYTVLIIRSHTRVTEELLAKAMHLQIIGRAGTGLDNIDLTAAIQHRMLVVHAPRGNVFAVSEHTILLLLALARHLPTAHSSMKAGRWNKRCLLGVELHGKVLGIIGLGRVGTEVAQKALAFGMRVIASDPFVSTKRAQQMGVTLQSKEELLQRADLVTLHAALRESKDETSKLLDAHELALLKPGLWLHVDGVYGAFGLLDPNASHLYSGLERADSVALDPHKWLATPIECSCAIVRKGDLLRETFSLVPPYLQTEPDKGFGGMPWFPSTVFSRRAASMRLSCCGSWSRRVALDW